MSSLYTWVAAVKINLCLLATICVLVSSCRKEGPYGFKTGQEYTYYRKNFDGEVTQYDVEVVDAGEDWVEFESEGGSRYRKTKAELEKALRYYEEK